MQISNDKKIDRFFKMYPPLTQEEIDNIDINRLVEGESCCNLTTGYRQVWMGKMGWKIAEEITTSIKNWFYDLYGEIIDFN